MNKRFVVTVVSVLLFTSPPLAFAQTSSQTPAQPRNPTPDEISSLVGVNFNNLQTALANSLNAYRLVSQENDALKKSIADMDSYLKACGDKPGCTTPSTSSPPSSSSSPEKK